MEKHLWSAVKLRAGRRSTPALGSRKSYINGNREVGLLTVVKGSVVDRFIEFHLIEVSLNEILALGQDTDELLLRVAEVCLSFDAVGNDSSLIVDAGGQALCSDLPLILFLQIKENLNL